MEIEIDMDTIGGAINQSASTAIADAFSGWQAQSAIQKIVTKEIAEGVMAEAIREAVRQIDSASLANALAAELQKVATRTVVSLLREAMLDTVCKLRGIGDYSQSDQAKRAAIKLELFK